MVSLGDKVGVSFPWQYRCFGGRLALNFESLSVSLVLDIHRMHPGSYFTGFPQAGHSHVCVTLKGMVLSGNGC